MADGAFWLESVWGAAHAASWFPGWFFFQAVAVALGALCLARAREGRPLLVPFFVGTVLAAFGAVALGSSDNYATWVTPGRGRPFPELEVAGFGAIAGLVLGVASMARVRGLSPARALDVLAPSFGVMIAMARLGCFFAGCDFGAPSNVSWALRYPVMTPAFRAQLDAGLVSAGAVHTLPVHPTQLYEACLGIAVLLVAHAWRSPRRSGDRFAAAVGIYALGRVLVDVFRGDLPHGGAFGLTTTQGLAVALVCLGVAKRKKAAAG
jgi:hypothetical protein